MSNRDWLEQFIVEAAHDPWPLMRTITSVHSDELSAAAGAVNLVGTPRVKVLGYASLANRSSEQREGFLTCAAKWSEFLPDTESQVGVLTALIDVLPKGNLRYFSSRLTTMIEALPDSQKQHYRHLMKFRCAPANIALDSAVKYLAMPEIETNIDQIARRMREVYQRAHQSSGIRAVEIHTFGTNASRPPNVRFKEIARSVGLRRQPSTISEAAPRVINMPHVGKARSAISGIDATPQPERIVSTGFADENGQPKSIRVNPGEKHFYFVQVGARVEGAEESEHVLPAELEAGSVIDVVMFTNNDGLTIEGPQSGRFRIEASGVVVVSERGAAPLVDDALLQRRMFFAFRAPAAARQCSMRCSFYCRGMLVQSRHITVPVGLGKPATVRADYVMSRTLSPRSLAQPKPPRLSVMLNENDDGTHSFRFYGDGGKFRHSCEFGELELRDHITRARAGFRHAAWGTTQEWTEADKYLFAAPRTIDTFLPDLFTLARRGRVLWDAVIDKLAGGPDAARDLRDLMRKSGVVQFALKEAANAVLPIAIFYDHRLDTSRSLGEIKLCPAFIRSLGRSLPDEPCLNGDCPNRDQDDTICPGGFWGFRHSVGLPLSIGAQQSSPPEVPLYLTISPASLTVALSTDPMMARRATTHLAAMELKTGIPQQVSLTRNEAIAAMQNTAAPIVYFYCHGGLHEIDGPYIEVGPQNGPRIARNNLRDIQWRGVRPMVFINGCHTTRVTPEEALELVSAFVTTAGASGVMGTEITIFESLATAFAEAFLEEFVKNARPAGEAVRLARLRLLKDSLNPLGLVYIPFVPSDLRLYPSNQ